MPWLLAADAVLLLHAALVLFVVGALLAVVAGNLLGRWPWVNRPGFRGAHVLAIGVVVLQAWLGITCPLTELEWWLRAQGGERPPELGFIAHWLHRFLYFRAPEWVFALAYSAFGAAVLLAWWRWPPRRLTAPAAPGATVPPSPPTPPRRP